jgi:hypothetical protein
MEIGCLPHKRSNMISNKKQTQYSELTCVTPTDIRSAQIMPRKSLAGVAQMS